MEDSLLLNWKQFAKDVRGEFQELRDSHYYNNYECYSVTCSYQGRQVAVTVYFQLTPEQGKGPILTHYTRVSVEFLNKNRMSLRLAEAEVFSKFVFFFKGNKVKARHREFDKRFVLSGKPASLVKMVFGNEGICESLVKLEDVNAAITDQDRFELSVSHVLRKKTDISRLMELCVRLAVLCEGDASST